MVITYRDKKVVCYHWQYVFVPPLHSMHQHRGVMHLGTCHSTDTGECILPPFNHAW
jgi:hypothetical protein